MIIEIFDFGQFNTRLGSLRSLNSINPIIDVSWNFMHNKISNIFCENNVKSN